MRGPDQARSKPRRRRVLAVPLALCATMALLCGGSASAEQSAPVAIGGSEQGTTVPIGPPAGSTAPQAKTTPAGTTTAPAGTTPTRATPIRATGGKAPASRTPRARTPQVQSQHAQGSSAAS